jgi:hypothetical protein
MKVCLCDEYIDTGIHDCSFVKKNVLQGQNKVVMVVRPTTHPLIALIDADY